MMHVPTIAVGTGAGFQQYIATVQLLRNDDYAEMHAQTSRVVANFVCEPKFVNIDILPKPENINASATDIRVLQLWAKIPHGVTAAEREMLRLHMVRLHEKVKSALGR